MPSNPAFISVFDLFKIGIGPSSSHTIGPMKAACEFVERLETQGDFARIDQITVQLYGSLALTGIGHGTDKALLAGLEGQQPADVDPNYLRGIIDRVRANNKINLLGKREIEFSVHDHMIWNRNQNLPKHPNGMKFQAFANSQVVLEHNYYSIGGGFITTDESDDLAVPSAGIPQKVPFIYKNAQELLELGQKHGLKICDLILKNELAVRSAADYETGINKIIAAMRGCIQSGLQTSGTLPGGLKVRRRAPALFEALQKGTGEPDPLTILDWVNVFALAVNEENASFGRVVTAPTNGAAGIIPAVLEYYLKFVPKASGVGAQKFLLTAAALGTLYKMNASISGAEVGCQGEVGVASSMAAGALTEVLGGTNEQIENAAEIAMEHHLGMTCDPVGGLVQIPCIERNAMGAVKAINAARMSLRGDGQHTISLDQVIKTMWETGQDMSHKYKETSRGGLAVNIPEC